MRLSASRRLRCFVTSFAILVTLSLIAVACSDSGDSSGGNSGDSSDNRVEIRWFVGLGTGSRDEQIEGQEEIIEDFNQSQDRIRLVAEFVNNNNAADVLATQIAAGDAPDLIGPVGIGGSNAFAGQYLDLADLVESTGYDLDRFDKTTDIYRDEDGLTGIPFGVFPSALYYNTDLFDEAGLPYPPAEYGQGGVTTYGEGTWCRFGDR